MGNIIMKIIDTHTHLPGMLLGKNPHTITEVREEFEEAGLCRAWICTTDGLISEPCRNNDILAEAVRDHRDFFIPFCTVSPHEGIQRALAELDRAKSELGMKGLKLHPWLQAFSMVNPNVLPILKKAGELSFPVLLHDGTPPYSTPLQIAAAAEKVPETIIILGHAGLDDLYEDAILACLRQPNIYLSCTSLSCGYIEEIIHRCPTDRLLYGSDGGFISGLVSAAIDKIKETDASDDVLRKIFFDNPSRLCPDDNTDY
jgi:predicted TIM-barrel fold metal-dependent hydrolase